MCYSVSRLLRRIVPRIVMLDAPRTFMWERCGRKPRFLPANMSCVRRCRFWQKLPSSSSQRVSVSHTEVRLSCVQLSKDIPEVHYEMNQAPTSCLVWLHSELLGSMQAESAQGVVPRLSVMVRYGASCGPKKCSFGTCEGFTVERYVACRPRRIPTPSAIHPFLMLLALSRVLPT